MSFESPMKKGGTGVSGYVVVNSFNSKLEASQNDMHVRMQWGQVCKLRQIANDKASSQRWDMTDSWQTVPSEARGVLTRVYKNLVDGSPCHSRNHTFPNPKSLLFYVLYQILTVSLIRFITLKIATSALSFFSSLASYRATIHTLHKLENSILIRNNKFIMLLHLFLPHPCTFMLPHFNLFNTPPPLSIIYPSYRC